MLLQARQHDGIAVIHVSPAEARHVARASILALLCRYIRHRDKLRRDERKQTNTRSSQHLIVPSFPKYPGMKVCAGNDVNARQFAHRLQA